MSLIFVKKRKFYLALIFFLSISLLIFLKTPTSLFAEDNSISLGYAPTAFYLNLSPGETYTDDIAIWSHNSHSTQLYTAVTAFKPIEGFPGTSIPIWTDEPYSGATWISKFPTQISIQNEGEHTNLVHFEIKVPIDTKPGLYRIKIGFSSDSNFHDNLDVQTRNNLLVGPPILIEVGKDLKQSLAFRDLLVNDSYTSFYTDKEIYNSLPVKFMANFYNDGETYVTPIGDIIIYNWLNQEVDRLKLNPQQLSLLNNEVGTYDTRWETDSQFLDLFINNKISFGKMHAKLLLSYSAQNPAFNILTNKTSFWIIPWKALVILLVTIVTIIVLIIRKKINKN